MALNLTKSQPAINITKSAKHLLKGLMFGLSWDGDTDLDASAVILKDGKILGGKMETSLVGFPMQGKWTVNGATYSGDALDGSAEGFDETIDFCLDKIEGDEIVLFLSSYSNSDPVTFGATLNPEAVLCSTDGKELAKVTLDSDAAFGTSFKMVRVFKEGNDWKVENVSELVGSCANGMQDIVNLYK